MRRIIYLLLALGLLCPNLAATADPNHTFRTAQIKRFIARWEEGAFNPSVVVDFYNAAGTKIGGVGFPLPKGTKMSGQTVGVKDLKQACFYAWVTAPYNYQGDDLVKCVKSFSAKLEPHGKVQFSVVGKASFMGTDWDMDVTGAGALP